MVAHSKPPVEHRHEHRREDDDIYVRMDRVEQQLDRIEHLLIVVQDTKGFFKVSMWLLGFAMALGGAWTVIKGIKS